MKKYIYKAIFLPISIILLIELDSQNHLCLKLNRIYYSLRTLKITKNLKFWSKTLKKSRSPLRSDRLIKIASILTNFATNSIG